MICWKKITALVVGVFLFVGLLAPVSVSAATDPFQGACANGGGASPACGNTGADDPIVGKNGVIIGVTTILAVVAGIVSVVSLIWGGIKYIASSGDASKVASAKSAVVAAIIGLLIALLARPIVVFVLSKI
jgi:hypothetical protein